jgi:hypothetical protein
MASALQADALTGQLNAHIRAFEVETDHAMSIDFALHMPAMPGQQPAIGIDLLG